LASEWLSGHIERLVEDLRTRFGQTVVFNGNTYACITEETSDANCGTRFLSNTKGVFMAGFEPRKFCLNASDFAPATNIVPPKEGDTLVYHKFLYLITRVSPRDLQDSTLAIEVYGFKQIG
jgi:hypothetical protein